MDGGVFLGWCGWGVAVGLRPVAGEEVDAHACHQMTPPSCASCQVGKFGLYVAIPIVSTCVLIFYPEALDSVIRSVSVLWGLGWQAHAACALCVEAWGMWSADVGVILVMRGC